MIFLIHWLAWLLLHFITFLPTLVNMTKIQWNTFLFNHVVLVSINFFLFYIVAFFIITKMALLAKKWFWLLIASLLLAIVFTYLKFRLQQSWNEYILSKTFFKGRSAGRPGLDVRPFSYLFRTYFQMNILTNVSVVVVAFAYRLLLGWFQQEKIRAELQTQKLSAELSFLKMQVNPHFLFNALNNIYSLSVIENTNRTSNSILKLSDLMRYMLYENEDEQHKVNLDKEIFHINNYIDLEKLRHAEEVHVDFSIEGDSSGKKITPLLLFPLIENAFKHGIVTDSTRPVSIQLKIENSRLNFHLDNYKNEYQKDKVGGIGVQNVKKRLDLIYGENYSFQINDTKDRYIVDLDIPL